MVPAFPWICHGKPCQRSRGGHAKEATRDGRTGQISTRKGHCFCLSASDCLNVSTSHAKMPQRCSVYSIFSAGLRLQIFPGPKYYTAFLPIQISMMYFVLCGYSVLECNVGCAKSLAEKKPLRCKHVVVVTNFHVLRLCYCVDCKFGFGNVILPACWQLLNRSRLKRLVWIPVTYTLAVAAYTDAWKA